MKTSIVLAAVAGLVSSASASKQFFSVIAAHSGSPIHLQPLAANNYTLWIGKPTAASCPKKPAAAGKCPKGTETDFYIDVDNLNLGAKLPSNQVTYIDGQTGAIVYNPAGQSGIVPPNAILGGWTLTEGQSYGTLSFERGLLACSGKNNVQTGPWQIYASLKGHTYGSDCIGFDALTSNTTGPDAWQYD